MRSCITGFILLISFAARCEDTIKVACIGASITWGATIPDREHNSFPAQLETLLGKPFSVSNYGVSGTTMLRNGDNPYWKTDAYKQALQSDPDIVVIDLGGNDSKLVNRNHYAEMQKDAQDMIRSFRSLPSHPRVIVLLPGMSFVTDTTGIWDPVIAKQITPLLQAAAMEEEVEVLDIRQLLVNKPELVPDRIHPDAKGAAIMAQRIFEQITLEIDRFEIFSKLPAGKAGSFYGYRSVEFKFRSRDCIVVKPRRAAKGHPWIWRARFFGHEPQTDIALLERGYHVVYCDAAELLGNEEAISLWNGFYGLVTKAGLGHKAVMEGMSRGAMYVFNWAAVNPDKVAAVYVDNPLLNLSQWLLTNAKQPGREEAFNAFSKPFNLRTDEEIRNFKGNPVDKATQIVKGKYPILILCADEDDALSPKENTGLFEQRIKAAGGDITVMYKHGFKHHPHSFPNPAPIVAFIVKAVGR